MSVRYLRSICAAQSQRLKVIRRIDRGLACIINHTFTDHDVLPWNGYRRVAFNVGRV